MDTKLTENGNEAIISITGSIDTRSARQAESLFLEAAETHERVTLDMTEVTYVSSAGIRVLRKLYMKLYRKDGSMAMEGLSENVLSVLKMTGLMDLVTLN